MNVVMGKVYGNTKVLDTETLEYREFNSNQSLPPNTVSATSCEYVVTKDWLLKVSIMHDKYTIITSDDLVYEIHKNTQGLFFCNGVEFFDTHEVADNRFCMFPSLYGEGTFGLTSRVGDAPRFGGSFKNLNGRYHNGIYKSTKRRVFYAISTED